jgi:hypothetical protein
MNDEYAMMRHIVQDLRTGEAKLGPAPTPRTSTDTLVTATRRSLICAGTERMMVDFGKAGWLKKAQQHDKVREVLDKARTDGVLATMEAVQAKVEQPMSVGYSNVGRVLEADRGVEGFTPGDWVFSHGPHAEVVRVPRRTAPRAATGAARSSCSASNGGSPRMW